MAFDMEKKRVARYPDEKVIPRFTDRCGYGGDFNRASQCATGHIGQYACELVNHDTPWRQI